MLRLFGLGKERNTDTAKDPICGMTVNKTTALTAERDAQTYYFCSSSCQKVFEAESSQLKSHQHPH